MESLSAYIPIDRRKALVEGSPLPDRAKGSAVFADISGFTPLTEALVRELGPLRGAEELTRHLDAVYDALIGQLDLYTGSVIGFSGDAITCWLDDDSGERATACALGMQAAMHQFTSVSISSGKTVSLAMKAAVATGEVRRFLVGDPEIQVIEVLAGQVIDHLAAAEHQASKGEVVLDQSTLQALGDRVNIAAYRQDEYSARRFGVVAGLAHPVSQSPWPDIPANSLAPETMRPWLLPSVYERLCNGQGEFLAEFRPAVSFFLRFGGIDYDGDESAGEKLDAYIRQVQHIFLRLEGSLVQLSMGDKGSYLQAAFGAPVAHEDDAVRAVSAALELRKVKPVPDWEGESQIGIGLGHMRTGAYGSSTRRTYGVQGDEVNLAARLMQAALPGQILASKAMREEVGEAFTWEGLPPLSVKGRKEPVMTFSLMGLKETHAIRLQEPHYSLPMVGRERELAAIQSKIGQALNGHGQIIAISGEAGIGKSRLIAEVIHLANEQQVIGYGGECQSYGTKSSYMVWQPIWRSFFELDPALPIESKIHSLETQLAQINPNLLPRLPLLGAVLNLTLPDNDLTRSLDAKLRKSSLEALLADCVQARARQSPLLFVLENCHWIDPVSDDLLEVIGRAIADYPVLLVLAFRPPDAHLPQTIKANRLPHFTEIPLVEFTPQEAEQLIRLKLSQLFGTKESIPSSLADHITHRAQGNPFYIEELLNFIQERGIDPNDDKSLDLLDLPTSLHSLILTRIDQRSESQKITLKLASVIGRMFFAAWLWGAYPDLGDPRQVKADLDILNQLELTLLDSPHPELTYLFKHIITQEVAYESLPFSTRALLHDQLAQFIERTFSDALDQYVNLLAFHYENSNNDPKKREYLLKAGKAAQANYSNVAAIDYFQRVLPLLPEYDQVAVMIKLGQVEELLGKWEAARETYLRALELARHLGDRRAQARCEVVLGELFRKQGMYTEGADWLERARDGFTHIQDGSGLAQALHYQGTLAAQQGDYEAARRLYEQSLAIRQKLSEQANIASLYSNLGILSRYRGDYTQARSLHEKGLAIRRSLGDRWAIAVSLNNLGIVALDQEDYPDARARLEEAIALQKEVGDKYYIANALNNLGNVARAQGDYPSARELYNESLLINRELGDGWQIAYLLEDISSLAVLQGYPRRAIRLVSAAIALRERTGATLSPTDQEKLDRSLQPAYQSLSQAEISAAQAEGRDLDLEQAIEEALRDPAAATAKP